jgi:hypothetical protein
MQRDHQSCSANHAMAALGPWFLPDMGKKTVNNKITCKKHTIKLPKHSLRLKDLADPRPRHSRYVSVPINQVVVGSSYKTG